MLSPPPFTMGAGNWPRILKLGQCTISKFDPAGFLIFGLVFVSRDFEVGTNVSCEESTVSPRTGLILLLCCREAPQSTHSVNVCGWLIYYRLWHCCSILNTRFNTVFTNWNVVIAEFALSHFASLCNHENILQLIDDACLETRRLLQSSHVQHSANVT